MCQESVLVAVFMCEKYMIIVYEEYECERLVCTYLHTTYQALGWKSFCEQNNVPPLRELKAQWERQPGGQANYKA